MWVYRFGDRHCLSLGHDPQPVYPRPIFVARFSKIPIDAVILSSYFRPPNWSLFNNFPTEFRVHFLCFLYEPGGRPAARCVLWTGFSARTARPS